MNQNISDVYNCIQELSWYFGNQGFNGECCGDLSLVEFMALKKVYENANITIQEIGKLLNCTKSGASKIIDRIESKGYVLREQSPVDGRICCVTITAKGRDVITKIVEKYTEYVNEMLKDHDVQTVENIKKALEILITSVRRQGFI
jgi:DNA-binding MarR family transcriptional regulator